MPYKLSELNAMSEEQLRALGESLSIKGAQKMDLPTLGFAILDTQAAIESRKPEEPKAKKKPGRPRKDASAQPKEENQSQEEAPQPKKRGRKPKKETVEAAAPIQEAKAEEVDGKQFIHDLFSDLKEDDAQKEEEKKASEQEPKASSRKKKVKQPQQPQQPQQAQAQQPVQQQPAQPQQPAVQQAQQTVSQALQQPKQQRPQRIEFEGSVEATGVLEIMPDGYGFLRSSDYNYLNSPDDIYVSQQQIKQNALKNGDTVTGEIRPPREGDKYFPLVRIKFINGRTPEFVRDRVPFDFLTPLFPTEKFNLLGHGHEKDQSIRIVDMFTPIGKGQRGLIVAQPKPVRPCC